MESYGFLRKALRLSKILRQMISKTLRQRISGQTGFTLVELVIIVIVLGILAAVAIPKYMDMKKSADKAIADSIVASARSAFTLYYSKWIIEGRPLEYFTANFNLGNLIFFDDEPCKNYTDTPPVVLDKSVYSRFQEPRAQCFRDYECGQPGYPSRRRLCIPFKSGGVLILKYNRTNHSIEAEYENF
ncbi:MAG: hypothetical protein RMJ39_08955 [Deltaproteobacteria bacterium]|nr:hypothetical protein [Deltaproteobacteria bacterium]